MNSMTLRKLSALYRKFLWQHSATIDGGDMKVNENSLLKICFQFSRNFCNVSTLAQQNAANTIPKAEKTAESFAVSRFLIARITKSK